jgi:hypothetical protein
MYVGDSFLRSNDVTYKSKYYVRANSEYPSLEREQDINALKALHATYFVAATVMESSTLVSELVRDSKLENVYLFDQRHFNGAACQPRANCCQSLEENISGHTLQETFAQNFGVPHHYSTGDTVAVHALALALLLGAGEVHLIGIELPFFKKTYTYAGDGGLPRDKKLSAVRGTGAGTLLNKLGALIRARGLSVAAGIAVRQLLKRPIKAFLGKREVSLFAEDFPRIFSDFQYLLDAAISNGRKVYYCAEVSNLKHLNGIRRCPHL